MKKAERHAKISRRAGGMSSFLVMDVLERAKELEADGHHVIHLEIGEPDFDTPKPVTDAAITALRHGETKYTHSLGLLELRKSIANHYLKRYGVKIAPERIIVASGTSNAMFMMFAVLINPGDEVIMSDPHYSCYPNFVTFMGGKPRYVKLKESQEFQFDPVEIKKLLGRKTRAILVNSPANPTGVVLEDSVMRKIASLGPYVISDEIYHGLSYGIKCRSMLEFTQKCFVLNGFSKLYAMTGWRLGYVIVPPEFVRPMQIVQQNFSISANSFVQWGGIAALEKTGPIIRKAVNSYAKRRDLLMKGLQKLGFAITVPPRGAFYIFVNARKFGADSLKLAFRILEEAKVAVTPGIDFGKNGEGFLRFSYTASERDIREGLRRLETFFAGYAKRK